MRTVVLLFFLFSRLSTSSQVLKPGFDPKEYAELLSIAYFGSSIPDSIERKKLKDPYTRVFRSDEVGLLNRWSLYVRNDGVGVIELRGTVGRTPSWFANFYAAMIPATGSIQINDSTRFDYKFADDPKAYVHTGWTIGIAHLSPTIITNIQKMYSDRNVKEFYITGHSQGGALSFLLTSYLHYQQKDGKIPADIRFKTYCSAAPKPGNLYYAYDFESISRDGWGFNIVNTADWVPETPVSIQTVADFNKTNPFMDVKQVLKRQKFALRIAGNHVYNRLDKPTRRSQRRFEKYLGHTVYKQVKKTLPQLVEPDYAPSNNYMRAGTPVILVPNDEYRLLFPDTKDMIFMHHQFKAYYFLLKKHYSW
jgi:predicted lipase